MAWSASLGGSPDSWAATRYFLHRKHEDQTDTADMREQVDRSGFMPQAGGEVTIDRGEDWWLS